MTESTAPKYYVVSMGKFSALYFGTMGLYALYWFYRGFKVMEQSRGRATFPVLRAILAIFFVHGLFRFLYQAQREKGDDYPWNPVQLAWLFVAIGVMHLFLLMLFDAQQAGCILRIFASLSLLMVQFYILYKVQLVVNRLAGDSFGKENTRMDFSNQLWMAFGIFLWINTLFTCYLDLTGQLPAQQSPESQTESIDGPML